MEIVGFAFALVAMLSVVSRVKASARRYWGSAVLATAIGYGAAWLSSRPSKDDPGIEILGFVAGPMLFTFASTRLLLRRLGHDTATALAVPVALLLYGIGLVIALAIGVNTGRLSL